MMHAAYAPSSTPAPHIGDLVVPRHEAAYGLVYQRGFEEGKRMAQEVSAIREASLPRDPTRAYIALNYAKAMLIMTLSAAVSIALASVTFKLIIKLWW